MISRRRLKSQRQNRQGNDVLDRSSFCPPHPISFPLSLLPHPHPSFFGRPEMTDRDWVHTSAGTAKNCTALNFVVCRHRHGTRKERTSEGGKERWTQEFGEWKEGMEGKMGRQKRGNRMKELMKQGYMIVERILQLS